MGKTVSTSLPQRADWALLLPVDLTCMGGREHDDERLPHERVRPAGLTAVVVGVAPDH